MNDPKSDNDRQTKDSRSAPGCKKTFLDVLGALQNLLCCFAKLWKLVASGGSCHRWSASATARGFAALLSSASRWKLSKLCNADLWWLVTIHTVLTPFVGWGYSSTGTFPPESATLAARFSVTGGLIHVSIFDLNKLILWYSLWYMIQDIHSHTMLWSHIVAFRCFVTMPMSNEWHVKNILYQD